MTALVDALGGIYLGGVQFTTDPQRYKPPRSIAQARGVVIAGIQATSTAQSFAGNDQDAPILLQGSGGQGLTQACKDNLEALAAVVAETYTFADWLGNNVTVWIKSFDADLNAPWMLYDYTLELRRVA